MVAAAMEAGATETAVVTGTIAAAVKATIVIARAPIHSATPAIPAIPAVVTAAVVAAAIIGRAVIATGIERRNVARARIDAGLITTGQPDRKRRNE
jgi:hypothetical protein